MRRTIQWLNANAYRAYPFKEDSLLRIVETGKSLSDDVLLDFQGVAFVPQQNLRLLRIEVANAIPAYAILVFEYETSGITFELVVPPGNTYYEATAYVDNVHRVTCTVGSEIPDLVSAGPATYTLEDPPHIGTGLVSFQPEHQVFSVRADGTHYVTPLSGTVHIKEGYNCRVAVDGTRNRVRISSIHGAGEGISCEVISDDLLLCHETLLHLNGLNAGSMGEFILKGEDGVELVPDPDGHRIIIKASGSSGLECV